MPLTGMYRHPGVGCFPSTAFSPMAVLHLPADERDAYVQFNEDELLTRIGVELRYYVLHD